jgi:hypothetical protein
VKRQPIRSQLNLLTSKVKESVNGSGRGVYQSFRKRNNNSYRTHELTTLGECLMIYAVLLWLIEKGYLQFQTHE